LKEGVAEVAAGGGAGPTKASGGAVVVIGASGQDGYFLAERLLAEGREVCATTRHPAALDGLSAAAGDGARLRVLAVELTEPQELLALIARERPVEVYNLAGQSSVSRSFAEPFETWRTNAGFVARLLETLRLASPETRLYQAASTDMFGGAAGASVRHDERSALNPQSPYASAKAAAFMLCRSYREAYNLRISCGILSNHESHRRPAGFLTRKIVDHVRTLRETGRAARPPLRMGHLKIRRDWGYAPDYVEGTLLIQRQAAVRAARRPAEDGDVTAADEGRAYRDYVLGTGRTLAVWELADTAFRLAGFDLDWHLEGDDPRRWHARFRGTGEPAVRVDPDFLRPADPLVIGVDPGRARRELGWSPGDDPALFLGDMLNPPRRAAAGRDVPLSTKVTE
jgi:GDPmannose 4,6-dehydratase